ncbi:hypothetical protein LZG00_04055 [Rhodobacteraceae bacterium LMO-12]|nr:hypothetical protein [Rhodobacteraceae bacterium LMO-JJ12]
MLGAKNSFDERLHRIGRSGRRPKKAYTPVVGPDGLIVVRRRSSGPKVPVRGLIYLACGFILFKSIALAQFGAQGYEDRLAMLSEGTAVEKVSAWVMQADRATLWVADKIRPFLR